LERILRMITYKYNKGYLHQMTVVYDQDTLEFDTDVKQLIKNKHGRYVIDIEGVVKIGRFNYARINKSIFEVGQALIDEMNLNGGRHLRKEVIVRYPVSVKKNDHLPANLKAKIKKVLDMQSLLASHRIYFDSHCIYYPMFMLKQPSIEESIIEDIPALPMPGVSA